MYWMNNCLGQPKNIYITRGILYSSRRHKSEVPLTFPFDPLLPVHAKKNRKKSSQKGHAMDFCSFEGRASEIGDL